LLTSVAAVFEAGVARLCRAGKAACLGFDVLLGFLLRFT
jgi:hypothetical protein